MGLKCELTVMTMIIQSVGEVSKSLPHLSETNICTISETYLLDFVITFSKFTVKAKYGVNSKLAITLTANLLIRRDPLANQNCRNKGS